MCLAVQYFSTHKIIYRAEKNPRIFDIDIITVNSYLHNDGMLSAVVMAAFSSTLSLQVENRSRGHLIKLRWL